MGSLSEASEKMKEHGTKGSFTREAKAHGESVAKFAAKERHSKNLNDEETCCVRR